MSASANVQTGEPRLAAIASWAVLVASFALSASTWIAMAVLAGFTDTATLPVIGVTLHVSWLMPVAVDGYVVVALVLWMSPVPVSVAGFAKKNTYGAAGIGIVAQSAYHLLFTLSATDQIWRVALAAIVGALPPAVAALAVHMRALIRRETSTTVSGAAPSNTANLNTATVNTVPTHTPPAPTISPAPALKATAAPNTIQPADLTTPEPPAVREVPTPADVATRITSPTTSPARPVTPSRTAARTPSPRPRKADAPSVKSLAAPAADISVIEPEPAQLALPMVAPDLLGRADTVARQYRTEHGTPITAGQLANRLRVNSEQATQALALLDLGPDSPTTPIPSVNGKPVKATR
jgi:hypothetical protein